MPRNCGLEADGRVGRNCNTYSNALCELLLNKPIPAFINRAAYLGSFVSCLMPAEAMGQAPVGGTNAPRLTSRSDVLYTAFAGELRDKAGVTLHICANQ